MDYILGLDGSQWQGTNIDFAAVKAAGYEFWLQRFSYSYPNRPNLFDPTAARNYYGARVAGMIVGGYHKIGWTDPIAEADFYLSGMNPLADGDLLAYDIEPSTDVPVPADWSAWEQRFVQHVYDRTGVWPLRYMNISMNKAMPAEGVVKNCASWVAAPSYGFDEAVPVNVVITMQQGPTAHIPGISANVCDTNAFFGSREALLKCAWHPAQPPAPVPPAPDPTPTPVPPAPAPDPTPTPTPDPVPPAPAPAPAPTPTPDPVPPAPQPAPTPSRLPRWLQAILAFLKLIIVGVDKK